MHVCGSLGCLSGHGLRGGVGFRGFERLHEVRSGCADEFLAMWGTQSYNNLWLGVYTLLIRNPTSSQQNSFKL